MADEKHKGETCGGCLYRKGTWMCDYAGAREFDEDHPIKDGSPRCMHFAPSLECRKVRALERIAQPDPPGVGA